MLKRMSVVIGGLAVALVTGGYASAQTATQEAQDKTKMAGQKTAQAGQGVMANVTDAAITAAVKTKFLGDTKVSGLNIDVDTQNHVVTLTGPVHSAAERAEAIRLARTTAGVNRVVSKLTIEPAKTAGNDTRTAAKAEAKEAKADTKAKAAEAKADAREKAADVKADARDKAAEVKAESKDKAADARAGAKDTAGDVKGATSDAAITSAVKTKLLADSKVGGLKIDVDTNNHVVTLTGSVHSAAEKAEAVRLARTTSGVTRVVSKLTIEPKTN